MPSRPDILVLGVGGVLGEAWLSGVLAGLEDRHRIDFGRCEYFVGSSAGSIIAARLATGRPLERPGTPLPDSDAEATEQAEASSRSGTAARAAAWALALGSPLAGPSLAVTAGPGRLMRGIALRAVPDGKQSLSELRRHFDNARFDGRLRIVAVDRSSGARVVFGAPGAPFATVGAAVEASCTVPGIFRPVAIGARRYVDGGVWSPTNLDVAPARRDSRVLCLSPTAGWNVGAASLGSRAATQIEIAKLRARGARVTFIAPDPPLPADLMARAPREAILALGYRQGLTLSPG